MHLIPFVLLGVLSQLLFCASVPFIRNPNCNVTQCESFGDTAIYYAHQFVGNSTIHILFASLDELTISIIETAKGYGPIFDYEELFAGNYNKTIRFNDTATVHSLDSVARNSFSLVLRRLIQFNDINDNGKMDDNENATISYPLTNIATTNATFDSGNTNDPTFVMPLPAINGSLSIDVVYQGDDTRDKKFPKLRSSSKGYFLNLALQATGYNSSSTRFAFEFYLISFAKDGSRMFSSRFIDDHFTPGIFNVWQLKTNGDFYPASMLWKPVVYLSSDRSIEANTLMEMYGLKNNVTLRPKEDRGIFTALYPGPYVSAFNMSMGQASDGFFKKYNYTFVQFTVGLDQLEPDSTKQFVSIALIISLALPALVGLIAVIFFVKRRCSSERFVSNYDTISN